ncbi:unannotated protein [freshwater metagenome]|uniref:Unannotated protein n=1 Tax=freshwater metagenome TaxID=449393 RepID=A0A6J7FTV8_9ZZZZ
MQQRQQRLHALHRDSGRQLVQHLDQRGVTGIVGGEHGRAIANFLREKQFSARRRDDEIDLVIGERSLIGDRECAELGDLVAPEFDADRMIGRRREQVENAAADGEFAALAHHVDAQVAEFDEAMDQAVEVQIETHFERDGFDLAETRGHRLHQRSNGGDDDTQRIAVVAVTGAGETTEHIEPLAHGIGARGEPFVRQRLPRREHGDAVTEHLGEFTRQVVGFASRRGDDQKLGALRDCGGHERAHRVRPDQRVLGRPDRVGDRDHRRIRQRDTGEPRKVKRRVGNDRGRPGRGHGRQGIGRQQQCS